MKSLIFAILILPIFCNAQLFEFSAGGGTEYNSSFGQKGDGTFGYTFHVSAGVINIENFQVGIKLNGTEFVNVSRKITIADASRSGYYRGLVDNRLGPQFNPCLMLNYKIPLKDGSLYFGLTGGFIYGTGKLLYNDPVKHDTQYDNYFAKGWTYSFQIGRIIDINKRFGIGVELAAQVANETSWKYHKKLDVKYRTEEYNINSLPLTVSLHYKL